MSEPSVLYVKKGKRYVPASPGQVVAEAIEMLHKIGLHRIAHDLSQRIMDLHMINRGLDSDGTS